MSNNTITKLRDELFDALRALKDKDNPMDIERARTISDMAQTIINSAKVEVDLLRVTGGKGSGFIPEATAAPTDGAPKGTKLIDQRPGMRVTQHRLEG
jgi:hypothetical protein